MRTKYFDLIDQTFDFPQNEFHLREDHLFFHGIDLMRLIGHHERRRDFAEDQEVVTEKCKNAEDCNLNIVYCVGET